MSVALLIGLVAVASAVGAEDDPTIEAQPPSSNASPFEANALLDTNCFANVVCVWSGTNYTGNRETFACDGAFHYSAGALHSAKNRCGNRRNWTIEGSEFGGVTYFVCMNPGGDRPNPGYFNGVKIGPSGENCP